MLPIKQQADIFRSQGWSTQEIGKLLQWAGYPLEDVRRELNDPTIPEVKQPASDQGEKN